MATPLENRRSSAIAEQDAGGAILPIDDCAHLFRADHECSLGSAGHDQALGGAHGVKPAGAGSAYVKRGGARCAELRLDVDGIGGGGTVGRGGAPDGGG